MLLEADTWIDASPEDVFSFFQHIDDHYEDWHPDHITFRWVEGDGPATGNRAYFEEEIAGELHKRTIEYRTVDPGSYIEFHPVSRLYRFFLPRMSFRLDGEDGGCQVTQRVHVRTGPIGRRLNKREFEAVRTHMREEGENLKRILERGSR